MDFRTKTEENDTKEIVNSEYINWDCFKNSTILVTGATGMIGEQIVKSLLLANEEKDTNIKVVGLIRNKKKAQTKFQYNKNLKFIVQDITEPIKYRGKVDYIIHTANTTSSQAMTEEPVETINSIVDGTKNVLEFTKDKNIKSMVYLSSMEVYGDIPLTREEPLKEDDYGYIDILKPRSSYPEGKKVAESLCAGYYNEYKAPVKIARLAQTIGSGVDYNDKRVFAEFARCVAEEKDIILKTKGETTRSYVYITDAVVAILSMLEKGKNGESYNVANPDTTCSIKEMAEMLCNKYPATKLVVKLDDRLYPSTTKYYLSTTKYYLISGWKAKVDLEEAYGRLIQNFKDKKVLNYQKSIKKKINFLQHIFSIKNENDIKYLRILGITITFDLKKKFQKYKKLEIQNNKIVFSNTKGNLGYGCNPKYIAEEIIKRNLPYNLVWLVDIHKKNIDLKGFPQNINIVDYRNDKALYELSTAKIWVDNQWKLYHLERGLEKKQGQYYIQTWHGSLGIKKIGNDSPCDSINRYQIFANKDADMIDYLISNSTFENKIFKNRFYNNGEICEFGHPRNDIFFKDNSKIKAKLYNALSIDKNTKFILYAPTFRNMTIRHNIDFFNLDYLKLIQELEQITSEKYVLLLRKHPETKIINEIKSNKIIDVSTYPDMQELLACSDILISDYSSCMFDFMLSKKPCFVYATDIEEYNNERGFYYPLESTPFPIARNNDELIKNIENFDYDKYKIKVEEFLKEKGCIEDGHASERVVDLIEKIMNAKG